MGGVRLKSILDVDQWTVAGDTARGRLLYHFALGDTAATEIYIASTTGKAVQLTTAHERFWNWLGAIPHWLYFAELRKHAQLWTRVVIATSLLGCFLVVTGIYVGVRQLISSPAGRWWSYRGVKLWHHIAGLFFGVLALSWVFSGLMSMNPWGFLVGAGAATESAQLRGHESSGAEIETALQAIADRQPGDIVSVSLAPLSGRIYFIAAGISGDRQRMNAAGIAAPLDAGDLRLVGSELMAGVPELITREDDYYFSHHHDAAPLPAYRLTTGGDHPIRYYLDAVSGSIVMKVDRGARGYRWLHEGLHRMDFAAAVRGRPQWDVLMVILLSGVAGLCLTGAYLGVKRVIRVDRSGAL